MPTLKDYESKKKKARRRPGREEIHDETDDIEVEVMEITEDEETEAELETENAQKTAGSGSGRKSRAGAHARTETSASDDGDARKKIHIEFPYSDLVRARVPKAFELAENVAEEWVNNGNFENVPVGHPLAQITVAAGLRKAKEVEKKLEEKGVFMMAKMGLEYAKAKINRK